jgi:hypothetical protein
MLKFKFHDFYSNTEISVYEVHNMCRYIFNKLSTSTVISGFSCGVTTNADSWDMLPCSHVQVACFTRSCFLHQGRSNFMTVRNTYTRSGQLDKIWQPHIRRQLKQEPCLYLSSQMYGSNNAHFLRKCRQHFLYMGTNYLLDNPLIHPYCKTFFTHLMASYFCSSNYNKLLSLWVSAL